MRRSAGRESEQVAQVAHRKPQDAGEGPFGALFLCPEMNLGIPTYALPFKNAIQGKLERRLDVGISTFVRT